MPPPTPYQQSHNRRFDGYKTHMSICPDSELIDEVTVTPANAADHDPVDDLLAPVAGNKVKPACRSDRRRGRREAWKTTSVGPRRETRIDRRRWQSGGFEPAIARSEMV
jgi:hypothetical protein